MATDPAEPPPGTARKRIKTENSTLENSSSAPLSNVQGKAKLEFEAEGDSCGICLSEVGQYGTNGGVSRGCIDSCDHYFCFVCIVEWAKVESKCPLCKGRFSTIRRPAKPPVFPTERLIQVPVRDQAYHYYGNVTDGPPPPDPYADAKCSICHSSVDEHCLLLCDLCDCASHSYCVGLGETVPEDDWFCHDCTLVRDEHTKAERDTDSGDQEDSSSLDESQVKKEDLDVFDIVRGPGPSNRAVEISSASQMPVNVHTKAERDTDSGDQEDSSSLDESQVKKEDLDVFDIVRGPGPSNRVVEISSASQMPVNVARNGDRLENDSTISESRRQERTVHPATNLAARRLQHCRNVNERIRAIRDNWNSIRNGSLSFPSIENGYGETAHSESNRSVSSAQSSSSSSSQKGNIGIGCPGASSSVGSDEISKAWKMMQKAKSIEKGRSTLPSKGSSKLLLSSSNLKGSGNLASMRKGNNSDCYNGKNHSMLESQMLERRNLSKLECETNRTGSLISPPPINHQLISSQHVPRSMPNHFGNGSGRSSFESPHTASNYCESSTCMSSSHATAATDLLHARHEPQSLSSRKREPSIAKGAEEKIPVHPNSMGNNDAKSDIQSLVKLNLKVLTKAQKLETDVFKQVARAATHSILVACGLEFPKPGIRRFPISVCRHRNLRSWRSTLMPRSCRGCYFAFVRDVVDTILLEKMGNRRLPG